MYPAEMKVTKPTSKRIHHEYQSYRKTENVDYFCLPRPLWRFVRRLLPKPKPCPKGGRPAADNRAVMNGIWYILWTGCQWKAVHKDWFGVCSSTLRERFQTWQQVGIFQQVMIRMVRFYARYKGIQWLFQAIDSKTCLAPLGGTETGKSPVDRGKRGSKIHLLVDQRGAPLSVQITSANRHDKWLADELIISIVVPRPTADQVEQHICMDKGYDYSDVHQFVELSVILSILSTVVAGVSWWWKPVPCRVNPISCPPMGHRTHPRLAGETPQSAGALVQESRQLVSIYSTRLRSHSHGHDGLRIGT
jgi:transposase